MFGLNGFQSSSPFEQTGTVSVNTDFQTSRKPLWLIALKLLGTAGMIAVGAAIAVPTLLEFEFPLWQAIAYTAGGMFIYTGIAFFFRPEPNTDNMGWGGGLGNDPFQSSDNVNRFLWRLSCILGPGRFTAETLLDVCAYIGLGRREEDEDGASPAQAFVAMGQAGGFDATRPIAPLDPGRFAHTSANSVTERMQLASQRPTSNPPAAAR